MLLFYSTCVCFSFVSMAVVGLVQYKFVNPKVGKTSYFERTFCDKEEAAKWIERREKKYGEAFEVQSQY